MSKEFSQLTYKEMYAQPQSFAAINDTLPEIYKVLDAVFSEHYDELIFTGCGTSLYLAQTAAHAFASCGTIPAKAMPCSELFFFSETFAGHGRKVLVLPITRKSYTTEVRMAIDKIHAVEGVKTLAITCDPDSAAYNDFVILSPDTAEESVIMTRSFTSMVYLSVVLALYAGGQKQRVEAMAAGYAEMAQQMLKTADETAKKIIAENPNLNLFITLGQGVNYGVANECMNKMKEMGIANSEAYYSLEYRHGPMSLVDENTLVILLANRHTAAYDAKLLTQLPGYGAKTLAIGPDVAQSMADADYSINYTWGLDDLQYAAVIGFIGQFLGYYIAQKKNLNADTPRHLTQAIVLGK